MLRYVFVSCTLLVGSVAPVWAAQAAAPHAPDAVIAQRERELVIVRHVREHLAAPGDGVALAADRSDLRLIALAATRLAAEPDLAALSVIVETWQARVSERTPFGLMGRPAVDAVLRAEQALDRVAARLSQPMRERLVPAWQSELQILRAELSGGGELPDAFIDRALGVADAAAAGRPAPYAGMGPTTGSVPLPRAPVPYPAPPGHRPSEPTSPYGPYPMPPPGRPDAPAAGDSGSSLPPGLAAFSSSSSSAGAGGSCGSTRSVAGDTGTSEAFLRVAECWGRQRGTWPGWAAEVVEALTWAADLAVVNRDCAALDSVARQIGTLGGGPTPFPDDRLRLVDLRRQLDLHRAWLRSSGACAY